MLRSDHVAVGDSYSETVVENLSRTQIVQYAGASGDYNPLHTDEVYAREAGGYKGVFAHGMLTMGLTGRMLTNLVGPGRLVKFSVRFSNQVWPGDTLEASAVVTAVRREGERVLVDLDISTVNQDGAVVVSGSATAEAAP